MKYTFVLFFTLLCRLVFSQLKTEGLVFFEDEIVQILKKTDKTKVKKIKVVLYPYEERGEKVPFREKISYSFVNDSIIKQCFMRGIFNKKTNYYGVIRGNDIFEFDLKKNQEIIYGNRVVKDSGDFKLSYYSMTFNHDTTYFRTLTKRDSSNNIKRTIWSSKNEITKYENIGDSIFKSQTFRLKNDSMQLDYEWYQHIVRNKDHFIYLDTTMSSNKNFPSSNNGKIPLATDIIKSSFTFRKNELVAIEKCVYYLGDTQWYMRHRLMIEYKK